jgi:internalin A
MHRRMSLIAIVLVLCVPAVELGAEGMTFPGSQGSVGSTRVLSFPSHEWLGNLYLVPESGLDWDLKYVRPGGSTLEYLSAASGEVHVPRDRKIRLWVRLDLDPRESASLRRLNPRSYQMLIADRIREDPGDLSGLSQLNPNGLFWLSVTSPTYRRTGVAPEVFEPIRRLTGLEMLTLSSTGITDAGLEHLRPLRSLKGLELTQFPIRAQALAVLEDLHELEYLSLNTNVTDAGLKRVARVPSLRWLSIVDGKMWGPGLAELASLPRLERLCIHQSRSQLYDRNIKYLEGLTQLKALTFWSSGCDTLGDASLASVGKLESLEELYFIRTSPQFTPAGIAHLQNLKHFKKVDFGQARIGPSGAHYGDDVARQLAAIPQLESIERVAYLSAEGMEALATIPNLKCLHVSLRNSKQDYRGTTGLSHLAGLRSLEKLSIESDDPLPDADLASLEALSHLKELNIFFGGVSDRGLAAIGRLAQLEHLQLTVLTRSGLNHLNGLPNLRSLNVHGAWGDAAKIVEADEGRLDLSGLTKLEDFYLAGLPLQAEDLAFLKHLKAAKIIMIQPTERVSGTYLRHVADLPGLERLWAFNLWDCSNEDVAALNTLPRLRSLRLRGDVTDTALTGLTGPEMLESVRIETDNPISAATVNQLTESHPVLEYVHITMERPELMQPATNRLQGRRRK